MISADTALCGPEVTASEVAGTPPTINSARPVWVPS